MSPLVDLRIDAALDGKQEQFDRILAERAAEQHWAGAAGKGGDVRPSSSLNEIMMDRGGEMCDRLMTEHGWSEADFRHAAGRLEASGDPDLGTLAQHMRAMEMFASEASEKEMAQMQNAMESMTEYLRERGVPVLEQTTAVRNQDSPDQHPRTSGPLGYPVNIRPVAEPDVDPDRAARGARSASFSQRLRSLAQEVSKMAQLSSNLRQRNRLLQRAHELEKMSVRQYEREGQSEVVPSDDPSEFNNVVNGAARNLDAEARAAGAQDDDSFASFNDWSDEDRQGSEDRAIDDVADQRAELNLDEDIPTIPRVPRPGERVTDDQLGSPAAGTDEPEGLRRNRFNNFRGHIRRGKMPADSGQPRGNDRYGARKRYSAESLREGADLTVIILEDQRLHWLGSHGSW